MSDFLEELFRFEATVTAMGADQSRAKATEAEPAAVVEPKPDGVASRPSRGGGTPATLGERQMSDSAGSMSDNTEDDPRLDDRRNFESISG